MAPQRRFGLRPYNLFVRQQRRVQAKHVRRGVENRETFDRLKTFFCNLKVFRLLPYLPRALAAEAGSSVKRPSTPQSRRR